MHKATNIEPKELEGFSVRHYVTRLSLFGSQLKDSANADSDADLLVAFDPEHTPSLLDIADMEEELPEKISKRVDLWTAADLSKYFREHVIGSAEGQTANGRAHPGSADG